MVDRRPANATNFSSFWDFYPYYLSEHRNAACRRLHVVGSALVLVVLAAAVFMGNPWLLIAMPLVGYGFAWVRHLAFEKNRPATFTHPL